MFHGNVIIFSWVFSCKYALNTLFSATYLREIGHLSFLQYSISGLKYIFGSIQKRKGKPVRWTANVFTETLQWVLFCCDWPKNNTTFLITERNHTQAMVVFRVNSANLYCDVSIHLLFSVTATIERNLRTLDKNQFRTLFILI